MTTHVWDRQRWTAILHGAATRALGPNPSPDLTRPLRDDRGNTLPVDSSLLGVMARTLDTDDVAALIAIRSDHRVASTQQDVILWRLARWAIAGEPEAARIEAVLDATLVSGWRTHAVAQPILPAQLETDAIEVYTDRLLCAMHASWAIAGAIAPAHPALSRLIERACVHSCAWLLEFLQPDNATNYPWAVHVMLEAASGVPAADSTSAPIPGLGYEAVMYAEALLHNCQVTYGRPDLRSAWVLLHASQALQARR
jgi:hypothetical protein